MSYNRKQLKAGPLEKKKSNPYKKDVIVDQMGQWKYPGQVTKIPSGDITMQGVPYPVYGQDNLGYSQMMYPGMDYTFPGQYVTEIPMAQYGKSHRDSVAHQADKILKYEQLKGGPGGTPLSYYSDPKYKKMLMDNIYPEVSKIMPNASAMEKAEAMDFVFNAGYDENSGKITKDPRGYALQEYYRKTDPSKLDASGNWAGRKGAPYSFDAEYNNTIGKLPENERRILMNKGRDWYYKNINNPSPGVVSPDYNATWYGRIWNTNDYSEFDPKNPKFTLKKKAYGGDPSLPNITGHYPFGGQYTKTHTHMAEGGWLENYAKGGQLKLSKRPRTAKNIKTSMNELFLKNHNLYGPPGKRIYSPLATVQQGGQSNQGTIYDTDNNSWLSNLYNGFEQLNTNADGNRNHIAELFTYPFQAGLRLAGSFTGDYSYGNITDPMSYLNSGLDILSVAPGGKLLKPIGKALGTESGVLSKTYNINPWAEKLKNPNSSYRVAGLDAYDDFKNTGILRSATPNVPEGASLQMRAMYRPTSFPSFQKGYADLRYLPEEGGVVFKTDLPTYKRGDINPVTGFPIKGRHYAHRPIDMNTGKTITELPAKDVKVFNGRPHWLKGYQELIKKQSGGQSTSTAPIVPKQFLTPEQREIVARQHGMDQGEIKQYDDSFSNNLFQFANKIDRGGLDPLAGLITDPMKSVANLMKPKEHAEAYGPLVGSALYAANVFDILPETKLSKFGSKELKDRIMKQRIVEGFEKVPVSGAFNKGVWMSKRQPDFVIKDVPFEHTIDEFYKPEYRNPEKFLEDYRKAFSKVPPSTGYSKVLQVSDPTPGVPIRDLVLSELQTRQTGKNYADYFKDYLPSEGIPINLLQFDKQNQLVEKMLPELRKFRDVGNYLKDEGLTWENAGSNIIYDDVRNKLSAIDLIPTSMMKPRSDTGLENLLPRLFYKTKTIGPKDFTDQIIQGNLTEKKANELMDNYKRVIEKAGIKLGRDPYDMDKGLGKYFPTQFVKEGDKFQTGGWLESYK